MCKILLGILQIMSKTSVLPDDMGIIPILWVRRLRLREYKWLVTGHSKVHMIFFLKLFIIIFVLNSGTESHLARSQAPFKVFLYTFNLDYFKG